MFNKIKDFFKKLLPSRRKIVQVYAALLFNANIKGFITGNIFKGDSKIACVPGLNCYSCPGAIGACPLGSLQNALASSKTKTPTFMLGIILLYSIILGRTICGFLCPVGLLQELLYKIKTPKLKKNKVTRALSYFKYVLLVALVIILPLMYGLQQKNLPVPAFCKYICPAGTFEGAILLLSNPNNTDIFTMLGSIFTWKFILLVLIVVGSIFVFRLFCRFLCPLGAIYGIFNKLSILGVQVDKSKCNHCQACVNHCKMDVKEVGDHECIQCGECRSVCHCNAISWKIISKIVKDDKEEVIENIDNEQTKKDRRISKKTFTLITSITASVLLIFVLITVNFSNNTLAINEVCEEMVVETIDGEVFNLKEDNKNTLIYFYNEFNDEHLEILKNYTDDNLNILMISNKEIAELSSDLINELKQFNILFIIDDSVIDMFTSKEEYPYSVFFDINDKLLISHFGIVSEDDLVGIISPSILGKIVGNKVGEICINKKIPLIGKDEYFSVAANNGKIIVLNFWFTSCGPCIAELPYFNKLQKEYSDEVVTIAIHSADNYNEEEAIPFIASHFKDYEILFGYDDITNQYYQILGCEGYWPTTFIIDQDGVISFVCQGALEEDVLRLEIEKLLK